MTEATSQHRFRTGWWVFLGLAVLTAFEFVISGAVRSPVPYLTMTAVVKAGLIVMYFMHVARLWNRKGAAE